jgi:hypothetical protein
MMGKKSYCAVPKENAMKMGMSKKFQNEKRVGKGALSG